MISAVISGRSAGIAICAGQATEADRGGDERTAAGQVSCFKQLIESNIAISFYECIDSFMKSKQLCLLQRRYF
jgi:hypothetical protein